MQQERHILTENYQYDGICEMVHREYVETGSAATQSRQRVGDLGDGWNINPANSRRRYSCM